ncbi:hypothetical protein H8S95_13465 [Pontibacter sp. KCTC 32443]|uniref:hypothetical protein n=1 Tax=Pontibacter TaxID=323449 RepID=UPI00164DD354|nr:MULTISPECIES: hypothetical protein [Pontibacter]MBC5775080.1 hypothetical protein [Pontibacter sp. KCTC 32443]
MKKLILITLLYFTASYTFAQDATKSDLYLKVVEVMKTDLNYTYDSTSNKREGKIEASITKDKDGRTVVRESFPITQNPSPLIILDGRGYTMEALNNLKLEDVETIKAETDKKITMMYGEMGKQGVVFITTKKSSKK